MNLCDFCSLHKETTGAIVAGTYGQACRECRSTLQRQASARSAQYARDRDREAHEADLLQPWDAKGNPSKEFITHYPNEAKEMFSQQELEQFG